MIAHSSLLKLATLLALLFAVLVLLLSRPVAQTSGTIPAETLRRNARTISDLAANPTFVYVLAAELVELT